MKSSLSVGFGTVALLALSIPAWAATVSFTDFSTTAGLQLSGNAGITTSPDGAVLRLTPASDHQVGGAFITSTNASNSASKAFSTFFQFRIGSPGGQGPADGFAFVLQPNAGSLGSNGGGLGYQGLPNSVAVEFDTYFNLFDTDNNHIAVLSSGLMVDHASFTPGGVSNCDSPTGVPNCLANGKLWSAWIDYDGTTLGVAVSEGVSLRPANAINFDIDIPSIVGSGTTFAGFTAATGAGYESHDIISWQYNNQFEPLNSAPEPTGWVLMSLGLLVWAVRYAMKARPYQPRQ